MFEVLWWFHPALLEDLMLQGNCKEQVTFGFVMPHKSGVKKTLTIGIRK